MSIFKKAGLTAVFMVCADMAIAATTGMVGIHGVLVDGGAAAGEALGIPHFDWTNLMENGEFGWLEAGADPHAGHDHGAKLAGLGDQFNLSAPFDCGNGAGHWHGSEWSCFDHGPTLPDSSVADDAAAAGFGFGM